MKQFESHAGLHVFTLHFVMRAKPELWQEEGTSQTEGEGQKEKNLRESTVKAPNWT